MLLKSPIYYNHNVTVDSACDFYKGWFRKGVKYLNDFVKENGEFYTWEEFSETKNIQTNYLQYYGTLNILKEYIKRWI